MPSKSQFQSLALAAVLLAGGMAGRADAQQVSASAKDAVVAEQNGLADANLRISVANLESSLAENVWVIFSDGLQVSLGDIAAGDTVVSGLEKITIDVSDSPSRSVAVPVKVRFVLDGASVELEQRLFVFLGAQAEQAQ